MLAYDDIVLSRRRGLGLLGFFTVLALSGPAWGQESADELARRHFDSGVAYLQESDYDNALKAFQKAYDLSKRPEILLNIATVHERTANLDAALAALNKYLELEPDGEHVDTVKLRIANLEKRKAAEQPAGPDKPPPGPPSETGAPETPPPVTPPPTADREKPNRLPAYIALGVGAAAAGGAVVTGIIAKKEYDDANDSCGPSCSDSQLSTGRSMAVVSTVLTGVAVVGAGLGVTLWLTADHKEPAQASAAPRLRFGGGPGSAAASALWKF